MSNDGRLELHKAHRDGQQKYTYFLLAAAGAAIGFSLTQTQTAIVTASKLPLALAVSCWGISFYLGCRQLWTASNLLQQNYQLMRIQAGLHPQFPNNPAVVAEIEKLVEEAAVKSGAAGMWQFRFLIFGALFYIAWHVLEMWLRTTLIPQITGHP